MRPVDTTGVPGQIVLALRRLRRAPGFTIAAVLLLGVGVGLGIPFFNIINVFLLKPAAAGGDYVRVVVNDWANIIIDEAEIAGVVAAPLTTVEPLLGSGLTRTTAVVGGISLRTNIEGVSGPYFSEFPMVPLLGRVLTLDDERNQRDVAVISERLWRVAFAGRADVVGTSAVLTGRRVTIVGVAPANYDAARVSQYLIRRDAWVPPHIVRPRELFGRLAPGSTLEQADAEIAARSLPRGDSGDSRVLGVHLGIGPELGNLHVSGREYSTILLLLGIGTAISLIAAGSFSLLLFARLLSGQANLSIRLALGATVRDLSRLLAFEAGLLALGATAVALLVGTLLSKVFVTQLNHASGLAFDPDLSSDWRLVAYTALTTFGAAGMVVARLTWNLKSLEALGSMVATSGVGGSTQRTAGETNRLVIAQTAVSTGLLLVAVMLTRTVLVGVEPTPGLDVDRSAVAWLDHAVLPQTPSEAVAVVRRVQQVTRDAPGVVDAAVITMLPGGSRNSIRVSLGTSGDRRSVLAHYISANALAVLQRPLLRGRTFMDDEEIEGAPVVVVSATTAARFWPDDDPLGRRLWFVGRDDATQPFVVVGVADDVTPSPGDWREPRDIYVPLAHRPAGRPTGIVARANGDGAQLAERVREAYRTKLPDTGFLNVRSMRQELDERLGAATSARTYGVLGLLVFIVAMGGLYGLSAHLATLRRREIGIRRALGATTTTLCRMLHHEHSRMLALGVGIGCLGGLFFGSLILRYFPTMRLWDPGSLIVVAITLYAAGLTGALAPFVRTMRAATVQLRE